MGPRSDIYSLAATFFELLTDKLPFAPAADGGDRLAVLHSQIELRYAATPSARALNPQVPADLDALLAKCMDPAPHRRYESAAQLAEDLGKFLEDRPLRHIGKVPKRVVVQKLIRRNRRRLIGGAALLPTRCEKFLIVRLRRRRLPKVRHGIAGLSRMGCVAYALR